jgi:hypothetical protein
MNGVPVVSFILYYLQSKFSLSNFHGIMITLQYEPDMGEINGQAALGVVYIYDHLLGSISSLVSFLS